MREKKHHIKRQEIEFAHKHQWSSPGGAVAKNPPANTGDTRDVGLTCGLRRSSGEENGNHLQYSCLKDPMDRGDWRVTVQRDVTSQTQTEQMCTDFMYQALPGC